MNEPKYELRSHALNMGQLRMSSILEQNTHLL